MSEKKDDGETLLEFPCEFTIKIIGESTETFEIEVLTLVRRHFPNLNEGALTVNHSKKQNYLAYTITLWVEEKGPLDALYQDLSDSPLVLFAL